MSNAGGNKMKTRNLKGKLMMQSPCSLILRIKNRERITNCLHKTRSKRNQYR